MGWARVDQQAGVHGCGQVCMDELTDLFASGWHQVHIPLLSPSGGDFFSIA